MIPARNEERSIGECLEAVAAQDYPLHRMEVLVVDGGSADGTSQRAESTLRDVRFSRSAVLLNDRGATPTSLNLGLAAARGEILCRVDARSIIPSNYVSTCVALLLRPDIAVAGGAQIAVAPAGSGVVARGIARALRNRFATGLGRYRRGASSGPGDTVYLGAFRTADLRAEGGWDERFSTNQDYELNRRMAKRGVVWVENTLEVTYRPRVRLRLLGQQYRRFGRWKAAGWLEAGVRPAPRQIVLIVGPPMAAAAVWALAVRRPAAAGLAVLLGAVALDKGDQQPADGGERVVGLFAAALLAAAWWVGLAEQAVRHIRGERLIKADR